MADAIALVRSTLRRGPLGRRLKVESGKVNGIDLDTIFNALCELASLGEVEAWEGEAADETGHGYVTLTPRLAA